jgi:hypothetical protein
MVALKAIATTPAENAEQEDAAYASFLAALDATHPPPASAGFDFSRLTGRLRGRSAKAAILHLAYTGHSVSEITRYLGASRNLVSRYLAEAISEASVPEDLEVLRQWELQKLSLMEKWCWREWRRSLKPEETLKYAALQEEGRSADDPDTLPVIGRILKGRTGNTAYMRILLDIAAHRASILGLNKPTAITMDKTERKLNVTIVEVRNRAEAIAAAQPRLEHDRNGQ